MIEVYRLIIMNEILVNLDEIFITEIEDCNSYSKIVMWFIELQGEITIENHKFKLIDDVDEYYPFIQLFLIRKKKWKIKQFSFSYHVNNIIINETEQFKGQKFDDSEVLELLNNLKDADGCSIEVKNTGKSNFEPLFSVLMQTIDKQKKVDVAIDIAVNLI